jgi:hypothetical protein
LEASNDPRKAFSRGKNKDALVPWLPPIIFWITEPISAEKKDNRLVRPKLWVRWRNQDNLFTVACPRVQ